MPLADIVAVVVRLFAVQTFVQAARAALTATATVTTSRLTRDYLNYANATALIILAVLLWVLAPGFSRLVTRKHNSVVQIGALTREDIYAFGFVFLGPYFVLSSIAPALNWIHYYLWRHPAALAMNRRAEHFTISPVT